MKSNRKRITGDFFYTFTAILLVNIVLQVVIYPIINSIFGPDYLGDIVYYTGIVYVLSASLGNACSNQRLMVRKLFATTNGDYIFVVSSFSVLIFAVYTVAMSIGDDFSISSVLYGLAAVAIFLRYYSEVQYRINLKFKQYFVYYIIVSIGYIIGFFLFLLTKEWSLIFIIGEGLAVVYVFVFGDIYRFDGVSENLRRLIKLIVLLSVSYALVFAVSQYYKIFLKMFFSSDDVTRYYVTSFFGKSLDMVITPISTLIMSYLTRSSGILNSNRFRKIVLIVSTAGLILFLLFIAATPIYTNLLYKDIYNDVISINLIVNFAQAMCAMASVLSVFVLTEIGSKKHFAIQITYAVIYVFLTSFLSLQFGLFGFGLGASIAFTFRFIVTVIVGKKHSRMNN